MSLATDLASAIAAAQAAADTFGKIVNGPATGAGSLVSTPNGDVPTLARAMADGISGPAPWAAAVAWTTGLTCTATAPATLVTDGGNSYVCIVDHTAGADFATDLAADKWLLVAQGYSPATLLAADNAFTGINDFTAGRARVATRPVSDDGEDAASTAFLVRSIGPGALRGYLAGCTLSNNATTPNTKLDVAAGVCADDTNAQMLALAAGTIDFGTTGVNGLDAGTIASSTWYHVFGIGKADGTTGLLSSTSLSAPTMPAGYTLKRRLGSVKSDGSAHLLGFVQDGDYFRWKASVRDIFVTNPGTAAVTATLSVPTGVNLFALINLILALTTTSSTAYVSDLAANDEAPTATGSATAPGATLMNPVGGSSMGAQVQVRTNTSAQIRYRLSASGSDVTIAIITLGWVDRRGRDA
jgi:hypothetical protein